jgi:hypothetical protein
MTQTQIRATRGLARRSLGALAGAALALATGCSEDPQYLEPAMALEGGLVDAMGEPLRAAASLTLPIELETEEDAAERAALAAELEVDVPYVRLGDLEVSVEWSLENLDDRPGKVRVSLNGGNEYFFYDPTMIMLGGGDEESPDPPALAGNIPRDVPAMGRISGVFREDQLAELSIDLDQITRGNVNPFRAVLQIDEDAELFQPLSPVDPLDPEAPQQPLGPPIPREAIAQAIRIDIAVESSTRVMLSYDVRVRDLRGLLHKRLMAAPVTGVTQFMPVLYEP